MTKTREAVVPERLLSVSELADVLQIPVGTIYQWRHRGEGPQGFRVGRHVRFDPADVARWVDARKRTATVR